MVREETVSKNPAGTRDGMTSIQAEHYNLIPLQNFFLIDKRQKFYHEKNAYI